MSEIPASLDIADTGSAPHTGTTMSSRHGFETRSPQPAESILDPKRRPFTPENHLDELPTDPLFPAELTDNLPKHSAILL
jgi:hypothetical protein